MAIGMTIIPTQLRSRYTCPKQPGALFSLLNWDMTWYVSPPVTRMIDMSFTGSVFGLKKWRTKKVAQVFVFKSSVPGESILSLANGNSCNHMGASLGLSPVKIRSGETEPKVRAENLLNFTCGLIDFLPQSDSGCISNSREKWVYLH